MSTLNLLLVIVSAIYSALVFPALPTQVPMHWNILGQVDGWMPKSQAVWFWPVLIGVMWLSFQLFPHFDPHKKKYALFAREWQIMQTGLISFFVYLQLITFYVALHPAVSLLPLLFIGLGSLFILLGNYLSKIRQNYFIGIRVPWTLSSEDNWNKTHRYASWCFVLVGVATLIEAHTLWYAPVIIFGGILWAALLPMLYSFLLFKKQLSKIKLVYLAIIMLVLSLFLIRLASG